MHKRLAVLLSMFAFGFHSYVIANESLADIDPVTIQRWHDAYRFPKAGWINLHIEGEPYDIGLQHGHLLAPEIVNYMEALASFYNPKNPNDAWLVKRNLVKSLFLKGFTSEQLEEMNGIAQGANDVGARFNDHRLDVVDIALLNVTNELESLDGALAATSNGVENNATTHRLEGRAARGPIRCDAFAAVGPATKDGKIVFGHITMFDLLPGNFYNVWIDVKPTHGHRFVMQTTPGGIQSGMDYSINDAGILISETTVGQTNFDATGIPLASRIRTAQQYATTVDEVAKILTDRNNGLSTAEWILADIKHNEIALLSMGTHQSKLYRSSKKEWIEGAEGFYWSNNNTKDQSIRLETIPDLDARPSAVAAIQPDNRDAVWLSMYQKNKGRIDAGFAKQMLTMPKIALSSSVDAKFTTSELAKDLTTWATFGPPVGNVRYPSAGDLENYSETNPLISNPWVTLSQIPANQSLPQTNTVAVDLHDPNGHELPTSDDDFDDPETQPAWHGTLLPKTDQDIWLTTAFANYERIVAFENTLKEASGGKLTEDDKNRIAIKLFLYRSRYEAAARIRGDFALEKTQATLWDDKWYDIVSGKGVLALYQLRNQIGEPTFSRLMDRFGLEHAGKPVSTAEFEDFIVSQTEQNIADVFKQLMTSTTPTIHGDPLGNGSPYTVFTFDGEPEDSLIVYGTVNEDVANAEAARVLQEALHRRKHNIWIPIKSDQEITDDDLAKHHIVLVGSSATNKITARFTKQFPVHFGAHSFEFSGKTYAHPNSAIVLAGDNPLNLRFSLVAIEGLSALSTLKASQQLSIGNFWNAPIVLLANNKAERDFISARWK